ncbi:MAG: Holliday junction resolvase RuvX [Chthoniobacteraceae bacterium]|nr:Holliday junction resolvase RuvX [Chthoniobacteraceae bacterium]
MTRLLGIDVGEARIGLALSDELGMLAHPLETVKTKEGNPFRHVAEVIAREKIALVVIGLPRNMNGTYGPAAEKAREFAAKLQKLAPECGVKFWDERLTTVAAQRQLHEAGRNVKNSRAVIDQAAAVLILQGYLDSQAMLGGM